MRMSVTTAVLAALNLVLVGAVGWQLARGSQRDSLLNARSAATTRPPVQLELQEVTGNLEPLQEQAVFYKSRRFYVVPPAATVVEAPSPDYRFTGSMSLPNRGLTAILMHNQTNRRIKVATGDDLDGWAVTAVESKRVTVQLGERTAQIGATTSGSGAGVTQVTSTNSVETARVPQPRGRIRVPTQAGGTQPAVSFPSQTIREEAPRLYRPPRD
jgi:hypothetical protein